MSPPKLSRLLPHEFINLYKSTKDNLEWRKGSPYKSNTVKGT